MGLNELARHQSNGQIGRASMTQSDQTTSPRSFATSYLPWVLAAVALVFYLITLNHGVSLQTGNQPPYASNALAETARLSGWTWQPALTEPVFWLITYPISWLPAAKVPLALNLFSALCAALSLGLLARTVSILPQNRTEEQRIRQRDPLGLLSLGSNWLPPVAAVVICGLQLSFWENATSASGEMFNLLMFAYVVRCVAEYRLSEDQRYLYKACFVFSAAMTNNWGMIAFLPLFLAALIWLRGLSFFNGRFLSKMFLAAFAGLLFYLLLPTVAVASSNIDITFWQALKHNMGSQKGLLFAIFNKYVLFFSDKPLWVLAIPSLLPLLLISIRWPSYFADPSRLGIALATFTIHFAHAVLFGICLWVMLDAQISARQLVGGTPLLSTYYLCALVTGYFAGYILLVFGTKPIRRQHVGFELPAFLNVAILGIGFAMLIMAPVLQVYRNLPVIEAINGKPFGRGGSVTRNYAEALSVGVPREGGIILSDDIRKLTLARSLLSQKGTAGKYLFLDSASLRWAEHHAFLEKTQPGLWKNYVPAGTKGLIADSSILQILAGLGETHSICYLHPSFGYYFEAFHMEPVGMTYALHLYTTNSLIPPDLTERTLKYNQDFWVRADEKILQKLDGQLKRQQPVRTRVNLLDKVIQKLKLKPQLNRDLNLIGGFYSRSRNYWAVEMQKAGAWPQAEPHLRSALELNPENVVATINLQYNKFKRSGSVDVPTPSEEVKSLFEKYRSWDVLMNDNGPFDDPFLCYQQGQIFLGGNLFRQSAQQLERSIELAPGFLAPRVALAQLCVAVRRPQEALSILQAIRSNPIFDNSSNAAALLPIEISALLQTGESAKAAAAANSILKQNPKNEQLLINTFQIFLSYGDFTNAMVFIDQALQQFPTNTTALASKGIVYLNGDQPESALPWLNRVLEIESDPKSPIRPVAQFNRAVALLKSGKLDEAEKDYQELLKIDPKAFQIYYGLGEIAYLKKDMAGARRYYELYLTNAPPNLNEAQTVRERLKELSSTAK